MLNHNYFISKHLMHIHYIPGLYYVDFLRIGKRYYGDYNRHQLSLFFFNVEMRGKKVNVKTGSRNSQGITSKIL